MLFRSLVGLGFVIIYKSSSILNFAQGEFLMLGAYVCLALTTSYKIPFLAAFALTLGFSVLLGVAMERLPEDRRDAFIAEVLAGLPEPFEADYVRLNIDAVA